MSAPTPHPTKTDYNDVQVPSPMVVSDLDDEESNDEDSLASSHQVGEIHATDGDPFGDDNYPEDRYLGNEDQNNEGNVNPRYPRRNHKKKGPLVINFENRCHNPLYVQRVRTCLSEPISVQLLARE